MILGNQYTASAYIPAVGTSLAAPTTDPKTARTIDKNIKVSPYMRVSLAAPANADTFRIESPTQDCKFVSLDGATRWDFSVTPIRSGTNKTLTFTTTVLYGNASSACDKTNPKTIDVTTDTETVQVQAINARDTGEKLKDDAIQHPGKWAGYVKYILPGGAIFTFIAGIVAWWKKRSAAKPTP